jgi:hypothetical protein
MDFQSERCACCERPLRVGRLCLSCVLATRWLAWLARVAGSLAPHVQNFTLTAFLPSSPRRYNREIINESSGYKILPTMHRVICST